MKKQSQHQGGFAVLELVIIVVIVAAIVGIVSFGMNKKDNKSVSTKKVAQEPKSSAAKIKHIGVDLDYYNPATNKAGDFMFTKANMTFNMLFFEYGFSVPANSVGPAKSNPQPTYIVPLGTKVHALVDGEVVNVPKLYSNDYSVHVQAQGSDLIFETEHVINVRVKQGDKVKAGQVIAEVSDYDAKNYAGMGLVEIGVLKGGNPPSHLCPFDYLDDSIKDSTFKKITALQKSWEDYRGDANIYDEAKVVIPGCLTRDPIEG